MLLAVCLFPVSNKNKKLKLSVCGSRSVLEMWKCEISNFTYLYIWCRNEWQWYIIIYFIYLIFFNTTTHWFYVDTLHTPISCQVETQLTSKWLRRTISIKFALWLMPSVMKTNLRCKWVSEPQTKDNKCSK